MTEILLAAAAAALLSLDSVHVGQVMVSRPVCVGPVVGWFLGDVSTGFVVGALVELVWISVLPIGPYTPPDSSVAAAVAVSLAIPWGGGAAAGAAGIAFGIPFGLAARRVDVRLRHSLTERSEAVSADLIAGRPAPLGEAVVFGLAGTAAKTLLLVLAAGLLGRIAAPVAEAILGIAGIARGLAWGAALLPFVGLAALTDLLEIRHHRVPFLLGAVAAAALVLLG